MNLIVKCYRNFLLFMQSLLLTTKEDVLTNQYVMELYNCVKYLVNR